MPNIPRGGSDVEGRTVVAPPIGWLDLSDRPPLAVGVFQFTFEPPELTRTLVSFSLATKWSFDSTSGITGGVA